ncbi:NADH-quinone oxidoreductase subunit C [bacterium]|nr:NADH-quinone oxidoreductase subunit C [bacterium]
MTWNEIKADIKGAFDGKILKWHEHNDTRIYVDIEPADLVEFSRYIFEKLGSRFIIASAVDTPRGGIEILYHFDFFKLPQVFSLRVFLPKPKPEVESLASVIKGTEWIEREMAELFGITFSNHPNPVHLLLPDDWPEGNYPLRRDQ